ncbi:hypothetical protein C8A01DRAFT_31565 [Parachaetomium inaequale]|uniref:Uncharacterized protein n=1 Tax=Parachaetomium inaequale TaxID=2588326 RepID=A0AAN6PSV2_9PEZI|nr:hypothetical protein C8A01DRAFT_31565 [Parachaetomium inaequale]
MRRCTLFFRLRPRPIRDDAGFDEDNDVSEVNEKRVRRPRDWSAIALTAIRLLQFAYFAFAYFSLHGFQRSSYFREDGPWQHSPDEMRHSLRMMRWVRMQASITLIYQAGVLIVPWLLRLLGATKRPLTGLGTVFGDGCAMVALLNTLVMLDTAHEGYCHSPPQGGDFDLRHMLSFGRGGHHHRMSHRSVCKSLDVVFGLGSLIILSHLVTAIATVRRAKRSFPEVFAKVEPASDVEQGILPRPGREEASAPVTPQRRHSPPPPYHHGVSELAQDHQDYDERVPTPDPRSRMSVETTSSLGIERYGYLVSDGWRAPEQPPVYSSRPPSLRHAGN